jgi:Kef-type K+ transport system membrane component KefB
MNGFIQSIHHWGGTHEFPVLLLVGLLLLVSFYFGRSMKYIKLPSIIGFMVIGLLCGPSFLNVISENLQHNLSFITELALGFVAFSIGLELSFSSLRRLGSGIVSIILAESFCAFMCVTLCVYLLTFDLPLALVFGSLAPASAPAGTVAVIKEYKARGNLTNALYAVVGFDDGLAIIIFGFASALVRMLLVRQTTAASVNILSGMTGPLLEILLSLGIGLGVAFILSFLARRLKNTYDVLTLIFAFVMITNGLCTMFHLSLILTNMMIGMVIINTQRHEVVNKIAEQLSHIMPLFFILFFSLAGAHLQIGALPSLGWLGIVYILSRSLGLIGGARIGGRIGHVEPKVKKYVGLGILSQAGVAIGLSLIIKHEFAGVGAVAGTINGVPVTTGDIIGTTAITTITATCVIFEIIGPIFTRIALKKAGEINRA